MNTINVRYSAFKQLFGVVPTCYQDNGSKVQLFGVTRDFFVTSSIVDPADLTDFQSNYQSGSEQVADLDEAILKAATAPLKKLSAIGIEGTSPAKGLGGFAPDPSNNPYQPQPDEVVSLYADAWGQLMIRGPVITDEGSLRDDFTGTSITTNLTGTLSFTNGSYEVSGTGTLFTSELNRDYYIKLVSDTAYTNWVRIVRAPNDDALLLAEPYPGTTGSGTAHKTKWITVASGGTPGTLSVGSSQLTLASGTGTNGTVNVYHNGDYLPCITIWRLAVSQRIANQTVHFGFRDTVDNPNMYAEVVLTGTDNTTIQFRTGWNQDEELSTITLPAGLTTAQTLRYKIDTAASYCSLMVNGVLVKKHENHVPDMYSTFLICSGIENSGSVTNTNLTVDSVYFANTDNVQVSSMFTEPMPVVTSEDQHSLAATLTTTLTTSNQTIISYTVPAGRVLYIIGYLIDGQGTANGVFKIGRNSVSTEPSSPGALDGTIFRVRYVSANGSYSEEFGGNPRRLGVGGDTILVTVTPDNLLSTKWRCALDFVLR